MSTPTANPTPTSGQPTPQQEPPPTPAASSPAPASGTTPPAAPAAETQPATDGGNDDLQKQLAEANKRLAQFEKEKKDAEDAKLGETERLQKQLREAQAEARAGKIAVAASKLGIVPELAVKLLPDSVKDDGIEAGLQTLLQQYPMLKPQAGVTTPAGNPARKEDDKEKKFDPKNPTRLSGVFGK